MAHAGLEVVAHQGAQFGEDGRVDRGVQAVAAEVHADARHLVAGARAAQTCLPLQEGDRVPGARGPVGGADSGGPAAQDDQAWASGAQAGTAAGIAPAG